MTEAWTAPRVERTDPGRILGERQALEAWLDYRYLTPQGGHPIGCYVVSSFLAAAPFAAPSNGLIASVMRAAYSTWEVSRCSAKS